ncbi:hypothetical protein MSAS_02620 [Mycobacterium saskatchewanense]|uniref:Orotidine 5'-phosphate decarboxylase n=1 Tax=Mycobacterium saskatchewanense TaxID=220927 RepID=A0AAJ3NN51_9MYCO|nr:orotidine 5'-phosphate decarboxylase / HUMPS family protein [Mycobacterium saskatchewanense]ORW69857.1 orotidine 5'-phosphate decarboxylase [Mycobacterium saskatchewanense]BBX61088.1 hypothetical protein MSAS_02620 [Mycobacterium saskatchewanense]
MSTPRVQSAQVGELVPGTTHGIIPALDVPSTAVVRDIVVATSSVPGVVGYKLGLATVLELGLAAAVDLVTTLTDLPIIYDHQKAGLDIPSNADNFARSLSAAGVTAAVVFPIAGPRATVEYISAMRVAGIVPLVGGLLPIPDYTQAAGGWVSDDVLEHVTRIALAHNEKHIVVPAGAHIGSIVRVAEETGIRPRLFVPGISASGRELEALSDVVDRISGVYPIVGRAVVAADDPATAAARLVSALNDAVSAGGGIR